MLRRPITTVATRARCSSLSPTPPHIRQRTVVHIRIKFLPARPTSHPESLVSPCIERRQLRPRTFARARDPRTGRALRSGGVRRRSTSEHEVLADRDSGSQFPQRPASWVAGPRGASHDLAELHRLIEGIKDLGGGAVKCMWRLLGAWLMSAHLQSRSPPRQRCRWPSPLTKIRLR